ncbi:hypothetical protein T02_8191 [Trichinella nativa]|uniref:Uncharacterized protein n=1 Tax=Trichinella nativa TaxID=6335 RepID=A0A0V1LDU9_9BILA|nr:hypothetical protein T02_8191 [Trichinella nativa]
MEFLVCFFEEQRKPSMKSFLHFVHFIQGKIASYEASLVVACELSKIYPGADSRQRNSLLGHGKIINGKSDPDYQLMTSLPMFDRSIHANARNAIVVVVLVDVTAAAIAVDDVDVVGIVYSLCIGKVCVAPRLQAQSALTLR